MFEWLVPILLFWVAGALYFGGMGVDVHGGTAPRQALGLLLTYMVFLTVWGVLHAVLQGMIGDWPAVIAATVLVMLGLPLEARVGFGLVGARLRRAPEVAH